MANDRERARLRQPSLESCLPTAWSVHRDLIRLCTAQGRTVEALLAFEHSRRPSITAKQADGMDRGDNVDGSLYAVFADLGDATGVDCSRRLCVLSFSAPRQPSFRAALCELVRHGLRHRARTSSRSRPTRHLRRHCRPVEAPHLVVIADGALLDAPFAALCGRCAFLIERVELVSARSIGDYVTLGRRTPPALATLDAWVLCAPDRLEVGLEPPRESGDEGRDVAASYRTSRTSCGQAATQEALSEALVRARIVHFAGHAVIDPVDPWSSRLVLSPSPANPFGALLLRDVRVLPGAPVTAQLVVLAACSTAIGAGSGHRDVVSLSSAFQRIGVPWVMATEWDIEDAAARRLFTGMHRALAQGRFDPPAALRAAQIAMIRAGADPAEWAGTVVTASAQPVH